MNTKKPENGIYLTTLNDNVVEIEGRLDVYSPIRAIVERDKEPLWEVITVRAIPWDKVEIFQELLQGVVDAVGTAQKVMAKITE